MSQSAIPRIIPGGPGGDLELEARVVRSWTIRDGARVVLKGEAGPSLITVEMGGQEVSLSEQQATALLLLITNWLRVKE